MLRSALFLCVTAASALAQAPAASPAIATRGLILPPDAGERLTYCERPLVVVLKLDSATAPTASIIAGVADLRGDEGASRHRLADEVIYVESGWGQAIVGADTVRLGPGSVLYVPPDTPHRLTTAGDAPMRYFFALAPASSAAGFRAAARRGCGSEPAAPAGSAPAVRENAATSVAPSAVRPLGVDPGDGERVTYCAFPLTITAKVDTDAAPGARLMVATGALRRGEEAATHRDEDEVLYVTHGRGRAFVGADTAAVEAGSLVFTPRGVRHGLINDEGGTLEYVVVFGGAGGRAGYRALAMRPGPYCPAG